jgi:DNA recombination protein RmuC
MEFAGWFVVAIAVVVAAVLLRRNSAAPVSDPAALQALESVSRNLGQLQSELLRLARTQDDLRQDLQRGREASVLQLAEATQGIRGELGLAQRALAEVKALEQGRAKQLDQASDSLRRLETIVAGSSTRGAAGENILSRALAQLPPDLIEVNVAFGNKCVEYALRLPGGRYLPIDSKWTSAATLERLEITEDATERKKLVEQITRDVRGKIREMMKYLDPERTLALGLLAVPDSVYAAAPEAHGEGYREGVLVVPYSLALPYVLALYRLVARFGASVDTDQLSARVRALTESLRRMDEELEGRLSKGLVQVQNARDALRDHVGSAQRTAAQLVVSTDVDNDDVLPAPRPALSLFKS